MSEANGDVGVPSCVQHLEAEAVDDVVGVRLAEVQAAVELVVDEELHGVNTALLLKWMPRSPLEGAVVVLARVMQVLVVGVEVHTAGVPAVALLFRDAC